jgi:hypothetical protein
MANVGRPAAYLVEVEGIGSIMPLCRDRAEVKGVCAHFGDNVRGVIPLFAAREWIPVTERLPQQRVNVLVFAITEWTPGWPQRFMVTSHSGARWDCDGRTVTHWMPLPAPPSDGN